MSIRCVIGIMLLLMPVILLTGVGLVTVLQFRCGWLLLGMVISVGIGVFLTSEE